MLAVTGAVSAYGTKPASSGPAGGGQGQGLVSGAPAGFSAFPAASQGAFVSENAPSNSKGNLNLPVPAQGLADPRDEWQNTPSSPLGENQGAGTLQDLLPPPISGLADSVARLEVAGLRPGPSDPQVDLIGAPEPGTALIFAAGLATAFMYRRESTLFRR